ncbi:hypothetical protein AQUCO_05300024v1 [Aquilegia coerulea]|uniref:Uncharacterized protein n=1 Tax=Aquilegia coerulea TaxID=218851 RepID=A0A2G5CI14_AQUCA|nr:hypothetical protein AQUCO_05300024v1 [Aquilegia coerulea]
MHILKFKINMGRENSISVCYNNKKFNKIIGKCMFYVTMFKKDLKPRGYSSYLKSLTQIQFNPKLCVFNNKYTIVTQWGPTLSLFVLLRKFCEFFSFLF